MIVVRDNRNVHKGPVVQALCAAFPRLHLEALPPSAPELNPAEGVWPRAEGALATGRPDLLASLCRAGHSQLTLARVLHPLGPAPFFVLGIALLLCRIQ